MVVVVGLFCEMCMQCIGDEFISDDDNKTYICHSLYIRADGNNMDILKYCYIKEIVASLKAQLQTRSRTYNLWSTVMLTNNSNNLIKICVKCV